MKSMSTRRLAVVMSAAAVFCLAMDAAACTAVLVGKDASTTGRVILGHNEDDDPSLVVRHGYVPPREWPTDATLVDHPDCAKVPHNTRRQRYVTSLLLGKEWTDESYPFSVKAARRVSPDDVKAALSAHPESGGWLRHASDFDETPSACRRQTIESLVIAFGETPADCVAQISGNRPCEKGYRTFKPLVSPLPRDLDDGDAAGRLERFFLPEPALR